MFASLSSIIFYELAKEAFSYLEYSFSKSYELCDDNKSNNINLLFLNNNNINNNNINNNKLLFLKTSLA
jgi:hypothetical protein